MGLCIGPMVAGHDSGAGFPIRVSPDHSLLAAPRGVSSLATPFIGDFCQGIHRTLLVALPPPEKESALRPAVWAGRCGPPSEGSSRECSANYFLFLLYSIFRVHALRGANLTLSCCSVAVKQRTFPSSPTSRREMGVGGLEPPTSALSGPRSSQLS